MENISLMIKIGKQQAFFDARKNEREREKALFSSKRRNLNTTFLKKRHRTIKTHHHVSQFVRCSSDFWNSHAVKCTRDVENTR
jgi:hypothetical protein